MENIFADFIRLIFFNICPSSTSLIVWNSTSDGINSKNDLVSADRTRVGSSRSTKWQEATLSLINGGDFKVPEADRIDFNLIKSISFTYFFILFVYFFQSSIFHYLFSVNNLLFLIFNYFRLFYTIYWYRLAVRCVA